MADRHVKAPSTKLNMTQLYKTAMLRHEKLMKALNGRYFAVWECSYDRALEHDPELKAFSAAFNLPPPLAIRDALSGGRTEAFYTQYDCDVAGGERIRYLDFCVSFLFAC